MSGVTLNICILSNDLEFRA